MDAVRTDQHVGRRFDERVVGAVTQREAHGATTLARRLDGIKAVTQPDAIGSEPFGHGIGQCHLKLAAMDGELRPVVTRRQPTRLVPDRLTVAVVVSQRGGADRQRTQRVLKPQFTQLARCVRQQVDAYAQRTQRLHRLPHLDLEALALGHQREREPADARADDGDLHGCLREICCSL